jgi:hypothetical protein
MMGKSYQRKTRRSRRKVQDFQNQTVTVAVAEGKASFQMVLPMNSLLLEVAGALLDRLTHHVHILEIVADSYRLKSSLGKGEEKAV